MALVILGLLAPAASAGSADVEATYLEDASEECAYDYDHDRWEYEYGDDNYSFYHSSQRYWYAEGCEDNFTTAAVVASVDGDTVASASVGGGDYGGYEYEHRDDVSSSSYPDGYYYDHREGYAYSHAQGWYREAAVTAGGASATASRGCESSSESRVWWQDDHHQYQDSWDNRTSRSSGWAVNESYESRDACRDEVSASHAGHDVTVGRDDGCRDHWTYESESYTYEGGWYDETYYGESSTWSDTYRCWYMADAGVDDTKVRGGWEDTCSSWGHEERGGYGWNESNYWESEAHEYACFSGVSASGPDGMGAQAGQEQRGWNTYDSYGEWNESEEYRSSYYAVGFTWENNPLGPYDFWVGVPLP